MDLYFSDHFKAKETDLEKYGAFNISLVADLPLFIDPFLLGTRASASSGGADRQFRSKKVRAFSNKGRNVQFLSEIYAAET